MQNVSRRVLFCFSGKNIKQLKVASDDKEKYDGCIAKDNEQGTAESRQKKYNIFKAANCICLSVK